MDFDDIRAIESDLDRAIAADERLPTARHDLFIIRRDAVRNMRKTMSLGQIAKAMGKTRSRIQQFETDSGTGEELRTTRKAGREVPRKLS